LEEFGEGLDHLPKLSRLFTTENSAKLSTMPALKMERLFSSKKGKKEIDF
jgi:hypothetical protein